MGFLPQTLNDSQINLLGIESSLEAMIDNILLGFSSAQFIIAAQENGIRQTDAAAILVAVRIGDPIYIYIISGINAFVVLLFVCEAVRNKGWDMQSLFDYQDLKAVIIGASMGGKDIASEVLRRKDEKSKQWAADPDDEIAGDIQVTLGGKDGVTIELSRVDT